MKSIITLASFLFLGYMMQAQNWNTSGNNITDPNTEYFGTTSSQPLIFRTNGAEAMRILPNRNVGIGTTNPGNLLEVKGTAGSGWRLSNLINASSLATNASGDIIAGVAVSLYANGDIKYAFIPADHDGWFLMDGRAYGAAGLNATQTANANALGFGGTLPNTSDKYLSQVTAGGLGSLSGNASNQITIAQNQLPDVTLGGTTDDPGNHTHMTANLDFNNASFGSGAAPGYALNGGFSGSSNIGSVLGGGAHTHMITSSSINGGVVQVVTNIKPHTMKANSYVYLGL
jgi:hypothetical protein